MHMHIYYITSLFRSWWPHVATTCNFVQAVTFVKKSEYYCILMSLAAMFEPCAFVPLVFPLHNGTSHFQKKYWMAKGFGWPVLTHFPSSHPSPSLLFSPAFPSITRLITFICSHRNIIWEGWGNHTCMNVSTTIIWLQFKTVTTFDIDKTDAQSCSWQLPWRHCSACLAPSSF